MYDRDSWQVPPAGLTQTSVRSWRQLPTPPAPPAPWALRARVLWLGAYGNSPTLLVETDPDLLREERSSVLWHHHPPHTWRQTTDMWREELHAPAPDHLDDEGCPTTPPGQGFGGATFRLRTTTGLVRVVGPWRGTPLHGWRDVVCCDSPADFTRGHGWAGLQLSWYCLCSLLPCAEVESAITAETTLQPLYQGHPKFGQNNQVPEHLRVPQ